MTKKIINTPKLLSFNWLKGQNLKESEESTEATKIAMISWDERRYHP